MSINNTPTSRLTTKGVRLDLQFEYTRERVSDVLQLFRSRESTDTLETSAFNIDVVGYNINGGHLGLGFVDKISYNHGIDHIKKTYIDHWLISFRKSGSGISRSGDRILTSSPGSIDIRSLKSPFYGNITKTSSLYLFLSRDGFSKISNKIDSMNHTKIHGGTGEILKTFLSSIESFLPNMSGEDFFLLGDAVRAMLSSLFKGDEISDNCQSDLVTASQFEIAVRMVDDTHKYRKLNQDTLCNKLKISRRKLYYMFDRHGGVMNFILQRRMDLCRKAILDASETRPIHTIAYDFGFDNPTQFSRQFRGQFGYSPTETREAGRICEGTSTLVPKTFGEWLSRVR